MKDTFDVFKEVAAALDDTCSTRCCEECAFNSEGYCGTVILRSVMAKLNGAKSIGLEQHYSDSDLRNFITRNEQREE